MVPPYFLDVQPGNVVIDMCAAPGSKTAQIIEFMHKDISQSIEHGLIIANDASENRCFTLVHQVQRLGSPCIAITNHDAQFFPNLFDSNNKPIEFDRVLCDVPCSGDGTVRKNPDIWRTWTPGNGLGLHKLQLSIALKGAQLLKVGGKMVYSTCSLNPIEDEAVVFELLRETKGAIELIDVSSVLPNLKRTPGVATWTVYDKDLKILNEIPQDKIKK